MLPVGVDVMVDVVAVGGRFGFGVPDNNMLAGNDRGEVNGVEARSNLGAGRAEDLNGA